LNRTQLLLACLLNGFLLVSCGIYSFSGSTLPPHIRTVGVPLFEDQTTEFGIDQKLTDALIKAVRDDNTLKIADPRDADAMLSGAITRVEDRAGQYSAEEIATDFRVHVTVSVRFEDMRKRTVMWEGSLSQWGIYDGAGVDRQEGIAEALDKIATDILNRSLSDW